MYRIDIQQGNVIAQDALNQVRLGMNKRQVQFILGTPLLADPFHLDRWDYYYQYKPGTRGEGEPQKQRVSLFFEGDTLAEHLLWQLRNMSTSETDFAIGVAIIDAINDDGYLTIGLNEIGEFLQPETGVRDDEIEAARIGEPLEISE